MLKRLQKMNNATALLCIYFFVLALRPLANEDAGTADFIAQLLFPLLLSAWILADANRRGLNLCYDYGSFIFFAWPVVIPVYLFQTRDVRALITLFCFAGICGLGIALGFALSSLRDVLPE
jgi:hypothetical protein